MLFDIVTAVGEAFANAVQHAHTADTIELTAWLDAEGKLLTRVVDRGCGFAPDPQGPHRQSESFAENGRGMWIMNACADVLSVDSLPGLGTAIVFARDLRRGGAAASRNG
jgi:anti-sigma regulatory factor (Ser/Thr protein kinase)